jgi:galactokinase
MPYVAPGDPVSLASAVSTAFTSAYGSAPALVGRAPGRVNLIGEHTDYNGGLVLPVALPHATYTAVSPRDDDVVRIGSVEEDSPWDGTLASLSSASDWAAYAAGVLWALREAGVEVPGMDVMVHGTVPLGAGLSSSAALECSMAVAACALAGGALDRSLVIEACIRAETEVAGAPTGGMDQTVAMLASEGSALLIDFTSGSSQAVPLPLADHTLLVTDTRVTHSLNDGGYGARRADCETAAAALGVPSLRAASPDAVEGLPDERVRRRARHVVTEIQRVSEVVSALGTSSWEELGTLFAQSHASMRDDFEISCAELDLAVETAVSAGAVGARMTGGGFGGSSIAIVPSGRVSSVVDAIDAAFSDAGFRAPQHLVAEPAGAAGLVP